MLILYSKSFVDMHLACLFNSIVNKYPNKTAIKSLKNNITFSDLDASSNQLMNEMQLLGISPNNRVGLLFNNRLFYINAIIALVKLSAAYVPLETKDSVNNLEKLCNLANVDFLLHDTIEGLNNVFERHKPIYVKEDWITISTANNKTVLPPIYDPNENPELYIMFTSGTTGNPKGVVINHIGVSRFIEHPTHIFVSPNDTFIQTSSVAFDASTYEIWVSILNGAELVLVDNTFDFLTLGKVIKQYGISILWLTTKLFETLSTTNCSIFSDLKYLIFGGEACSYKHIMAAYHLLPKTKLVNGYGPTENTVFTTMHQITEADKKRNYIPIGTPVSDTNCYLLNESLEPVVDDSEGMLFVGGDGLAQSYLDEDATAKKFITHPTLGVRMYKTGDVVKYNPSFGFQYIGRADRQVKVRGFRVELDLVEAVASMIDNLMHAYAIYNTQQFKHGLELYYTTNDKKEIDKQFFLAHLQQHLPWYSIPATIIHLEDTKYNLSNKVDLKHLVKDSVERLNNETLSIREEKDVLKKIWCYALETSHINDYDNFYNDCGGDSITSLILMNEVNKELNLNLPVGYLIANPCFFEFKKNLYKENSDIKGIIQLKEGKGEIPLFLIPGAGGGPEFYISLANKITTSLNVYSFAKIEKFDPDNKTDIHKVDKYFIKRFARVYSSYITNKSTSKKIILAGYSIGGNIAVEIKHMLDKKGIKTVAIHLFDTYKLGNTAINVSHELNFSKSHIKILVLTLKRAIVTKKITYWTTFAKLLFLSEINSKKIKNTEVFLYRCNDVYGTVKDTTSLGWDKKATDLEIIKVDTNHAIMFNDVNTDFLAKKMDEKLSIYAPKTSAQVYSPTLVLTEALDDYLSKGWFRIKQQLFTDDRSIFNNEIFDVTWIRYNLRLYQQRKSHKRIYQLNNNLIINIIDFNFEEYMERKVELEQLYSKYLTSIDFDAKKTVYNVLYNTKKITKEVFQSKLITAYEADKLVGIGIFDIGLNSGAQILNYHDPAYAKNSLSRYTVLKTIEYLNNLGYQHFYPGYIFNEHSKMDYKLSLGSEIVEYLDYQTKTWEPYSNLQISRLQPKSETRN